MLQLTQEEIQALWISLKVSTTAVLLSLPAAILIAYFLARSRTRLKSIIETLVYLPLVMPPIVTGYLLLVLMGKQGPIGSLLDTLGIRITFTWLGAALAAAVVGFPLMVRSMRLAFQAIDPRLEMAAQSLGASRINSFFSVTLPLATRGVMAGCILGFARCLGEFGATIMVAGNIAGETQTIPLAIFSLVQRPHGVAQSWRLVVVSIMIAFIALMMSEYLERKERQRELS